MSQIHDPATAQNDPTQTLEARTQRIRDKLKAQRAQSEMIYDIAVEMLEIDRLGLWQAAAGVDPNDKTKKGKKKKKKKGQMTREVWVKKTFGISLRQARKYFNVAEHLRREEIAGSGLCLDRMEQLALCPPALRPTLLSLGAEEGLSAHALSAGRRAGMAILGEGNEVEAIAEMIKVARACDHKEEREDLKEKSKKSRPSPEGEKDEAPDAGYACELVAAALQELEDLAAQGGPIDQGAVAALVKAAEQLGEAGRLLLARATGQPEASAADVVPEAPAAPAPAAPAPAPAPPAPEPQAEPAPPAPPPTSSGPPAPAGQDAPAAARKSTSSPIMFTPLIAVLRTLGMDEVRMRAMLHAVLANLPFNTAPLAEALRKAGVDASLVASFEELLNKPTHEERARFAFWFAEKAEPVWLEGLLDIMDHNKLPPSVRERAAQWGRDREAQLR